MRRVAKAIPRRRLEADVARELILDATEKRLVEAGPAGIRLQDVAADAGVSHPTVLHHFGSRELLVKAVITRSIRAIHSNLVEAIAACDGDTQGIEGLVENVAHVLETSGHARVILWLALAGHTIEPPDSGLREVIDAAHAMRLSQIDKQAQNHESPPLDDTARIVVLVTLALVSGAVLGRNVLANAGLPSDAVGQTQFRMWLSRWLLDRLKP